MSIIVDVLKVTVGLLVKIGLHALAKKLKEGDVTDEQLRKLIICQIEDVKSKLDGLARKGLLASISFYKEGLVYLYKVLDFKNSEEDGKVTVEGAEGREKNLASAASVKTISLAEEMRSLHLTDPDGSAERALSDAKDRFKQAREKATEAFCNEALSTSDRILAIQYRVMATLLEKVDNLTEALAACRLCLEELHSMPAVQKSFNVQLKQGLKSWLNKAEREEIIRSVCRINRVIFYVTQLVGEDANLLCWPCVDNGEEQVDPLRDSRVTELLREHEMERLLLKPRSLFQPGEEEKEFEPRCITANAQGQFFVIGHCNGLILKVFERSGKHLHSFHPPDPCSRVFGWRIQDIATDRNNWAYLLVNIGDADVYGADYYMSMVCVYDEGMDLQKEIHVGRFGGFRGLSITVSDNGKLFVAMEKTLKQEVRVLSRCGKFLNESREGILKNVLDLTCTTSAERIMVLDRRGEGPDDTWVWLLNEKAKFLSYFTVQQSLPGPLFGSIAFHRASEHVFVFLSGCYLDEKYPRTLYIFEKGKLIRRTLLNKDLHDFIHKATVTSEGLVAMFTTARPGPYQRMLFVI